MSDRAEINALRDEVKARLSFVDVLAIEGLQVRRSGPNFVVCCPFHAERTPSFTIHAGKLHRGHCYGCGWDGDVLDFWRERRGGGYVDSLRALASLASIPVHLREWNSRQAAQVPQVTGAALGEREKPALPRLRALGDEEVRALAELRGLSVRGVAAAAADKRVGGCAWPQFLRHGVWVLSDDAGPAWVVTDGERWVAQFRLLSGGTFTIRREGEEPEQIKCWTKGAAPWPLGAAEMGDRAAVLMVEGGADMLAAYHFLERFGRLGDVAVVAMLGASNRIAAEALPFFRRRRVRIMMDEDEPKYFKDAPEKPPVFPGKEAAARWTEQLCEAGAAVETFSLAGLTRRDGRPVKDLNDLALMGEGAAWERGGELREAFFDFDF